MPPVAIMGRVFFLFLLIGIIGLFLYFAIIYLLKPKASIVVAKVDAGHEVDEATSEVIKEEIYEEANKKIKDFKTKRGRKKWIFYFFY